MLSSAMTLERLQVVMEANTKKFNEELKNVQKQVKAMSDSVNTQVSKVKSAIGAITKSIAGLYALGKVGQYIKNSVQSAMQVEASLQQVARTMGESTQSFLKWAETNALSFNMAQSDALKFGATYSNLVSSFLTDTNQITGATTDLLKASSVIASATGRTMDDVMERIRSGLLGNTEAIEDLGVNVNVALLETTEAFKRLANGKSWNQLSFQTQQQIRLMAILEQTSSKFGNEVFQNTNSSLQQLVAILKDVALNLGNAFLPIANVVIPLLSKMAMWLRTVTSYFATFMQTLFGYSPKANAGIGGTVNSTVGQVGSLGDSLDSAGTSADKTKKKLQNLLGGFDELNTLNSDTSDSGGSGGTSGNSGVGGGGVDLGGLGNWDGYDLGEPDTSGIVRAAERVKETFKSIARFISDHKEIILAVVGGLAAGIATYLGIDAIGGVGALSTAFGLLPIYIAEACSGVIGAVTGIIAGISWPAVAIAALVGGIVASFIYLWQTSDEFRQSLIDGWNSLVSALSPYVQAVCNLFNLIVDIIVTVLKPIVATIADIFVTVTDNVIRVLMALWNNVLAPFVQFIGECVKMIVDGLAEIWNHWKPTFEQIGEAIFFVWNQYMKPFVNWIGTTLIEGFKVFGKAVEPVLEALKVAFKGLIDFIVGIFTGDWNKALTGLKNIFKGVFDAIGSIGDSVWQGIKKVWSVASEWFGNNVSKPIGNFFTGMWDKVKETASTTWKWITNLFAKGGQIFSGITEGIVGAFKTVVNALISGINKIIATPFNTINGLLNKIRSIEVMGMKPFSGMWSVNPLSVPQIPKLARGGIVDSATLFMAGEAGKEVVMPLENNTGWMSEVASRIASQLPQNQQTNNNDQPINVTLQIGSTTLGKIAIEGINKVQRKAGTTLIKV